MMAAMDASPGASVFKAIGDPTRRAILDLLAESERSVGELTDAFPMSQPAMSQHLKVLRTAGLVTPRKDGRRRLYRVAPEPLREVYDWVQHYERFWDDKLDALGRFLDAEVT